MVYCVHGTFIASLLSGIFSGVAIGIGKEYGDYKAVGNYWDWYDIVADFAGAVVGSVLGSIHAIM